jgi:flagellar protein FliS
MSYQMAAVQSANPIGLVIILYDRLVGDLTTTIEAIRNKNIEARCRAADHALLILQHLQSSLDMTHGGETAQSLSQFYDYLRAKLMEAQVKLDPEILTQEIELILQVRQTWNQVDSPAEEPQPSASHKDVVLGNAYGASSEESLCSNWSA